MGRSRYGPEPWLGNGRWLDPGIVAPLQIAIVKRALDDILIAELPLGSNRSATIDHYLRRARVSEADIDAGKGYWCGAALGAWWEDAGAEIPDDYANCDKWLAFAQQTGQWVDAATASTYTQNQMAGAAALFGVGSDATHIGAIVRWDRVRDYISGNTSSNGNSSNGTMVAVHDMPTVGLLGFVRPVARV